MTNIDYDQLRGEVGGEPPDGVHQAYLARAALVSTSSGDRLVTEWQCSDPPYYWTTWFGFEGQRMGFTQDFLDSVGIARSKLTDDDVFEDELSRVTGTVYSVRTEAGAAWVNTYVEEALVSPVGQTSLDDVPIDTAGMGATAPAPEQQQQLAGVGGRYNVPDDDVPF